MDDTDFKKQRTSLFVISISIILYILGDGHIGDKGSIFGGSIIFGKPEVLEFAGIMIFLWFLWRYLITGRNMINGYVSHYKLNLYFNPRYGELLNEAFSKVPEDSVKYTENVNAIANFKKVWNENSIGEKYNSGKLPPLIKRLYWPNKFHYYRNGEYTIWTSRLDDIDNGLEGKAFTLKRSKNDSSIEFKAPFFSLILLELKVLISTSIKKKVFSDSIAPLLFAGAAICLMIKSLICTLLI